MSNTTCPRVLFITPCAFNHTTGGGITFTNLFRGWPVSSLATITDDIVPTTTDVCNRFYFLTSDERRYRGPFCAIVKRPTAAAQENHHSEEKKGSNLLHKTAKAFLGDAGIPDQGIITKGLRAWIKEFKPDVIYTILGSLGYIDLVKKISEEFSLPIVIHLMDEGVTDPKWKGLFGTFIRYAYSKEFRSLLRKTANRIAICPAMAEAYSKRYKTTFESIQNTIDVSRWSSIAKKDTSTSGTIKIIYSGAIFSFAQSDSLYDSLKAIEELKQEGIPISTDIYTPLRFFKDYQPLREAFPETRFHEVIGDDEMFFKSLAHADILLLPSNFSKEARHFLKYSMPTKVPPYLTSGTPILVYGPEDIAQVQYAQKDSWGYIVTKQGTAHVKHGLQTLINDAQLRSRLSNQAKRIAEANHDVKIVKTKFQEILQGAVAHA